MATKHYLLRKKHTTFEELDAIIIFFFTKYSQFIRLKLEIFETT